MFIFVRSLHQTLTTTSFAYSQIWIGLQWTTSAHVIAAGYWKFAKFLVSFVGPGSALTLYSDFQEPATNDEQHRWREIERERGERNSEGAEQFLSFSYRKLLGIVLNFPDNSVELMAFISDLLLLWLLLLRLLFVLPLTACLRWHLFQFHAPETHMFPRLLSDAHMQR